VSQRSCRPRKKKGRSRRLVGEKKKKKKNRRRTPNKKGWKERGICQKGKGEEATVSLTTPISPLQEGKGKNIHLFTEKKEKIGNKSPILYAF